MALPTQWTHLSELQETVEDREAWRAAIRGCKDLDKTEGLNHRLCYVKQVHREMSTVCLLSVEAT